MIPGLLRRVCRLYPLLSGQGTLLQQPPLSWLHFEEQRAHTRLRNGFTLVVFPNDFIGKSVLLFGDLDPKITRTLSLILDRGDTLVDVGANVGVVSMAALSEVGPGGRVVAVEPQSACCEVLRETIALNGVKNLELHQLALSDQNGTLQLHLPESENLGRASFETGSRSAVRSTEVGVRDGSEFLESLKLTGEYVVKIDVEGHEDSVIRGFSRYFKLHAPKAVIFESAPDMYPGKRFQETATYELLSRQGFRILRIHKSAFTLQFSPVGQDSPVRESTDFVAVREDLQERLSHR